MRVGEESLEMSLEMSQQSELATGAPGAANRQGDSTDFADRSISRRRKWSSGAR